ncbi:MAG: hypothetical protein BGN91_06945 [Nitrobacter sp. 62-13]|nr:MAG: hypothetical protein BGN91_06945 [Nitrobacter sp. 62-13]
MHLTHHICGISLAWLCISKALRAPPVLDPVQGVFDLVPLATEHAVMLDRLARLDFDVEQMSPATGERDALQWRVIV